MHKFHVTFTNKITMLPFTSYVLAYDFAEAELKGRRDLTKYIELHPEDAPIENFVVTRIHLLDKGG